MDIRDLTEGMLVYIWVPPGSAPETYKHWKTHMEPYIGTYGRVAQVDLLHHDALIHLQDHNSYWFPDFMLVDGQKALSRDNHLKITPFEWGD